MLLRQLCYFFSTWIFLLSSPIYAQTMESIALTHLANYAKDYGLERSDLAELYVVDDYASQRNGIHHLYFQQQIRGIDIFGAVASVHISRDQQTIFHSNQLLNQLTARIETHSPVLNPVEAIVAAAEYVGLEINEPLHAHTDPIGDEQAVQYTDGGISQEDIPIHLVWYESEDEQLRLAWSVRIYPHSGDHWWTIHVDASDGEIQGSYDWVHADHWDHPRGAAGDLLSSDCEEFSDALPLTHFSILSSEQYRVFPFPIESPNHGSRQLVSNPADATASPYGWHDVDGIAGAEYTVTRGNNVDAYLDTGNNNNPVNGDADRADGGSSFLFDFPLDDTQAPNSYQDAALTNLFYWTNVLHDILYQYGFDEAAGNFQTNTYGNGGAGNDALKAEAQDSGGSNDANFSTPPDGLPPRMQLHIWNNTSPNRAGELDNGIVIHEYAHGLSNRLVGGPSNVFCLLNGEQMGEGWSDWLALLLTMQVGDSRNDARGLGTYALGQSTDGSGNRPKPYSTDFAVNDFTYGDLAAQSAPYGVGFGWASILWEITWDLVDEYGFDLDWYEGTGGNNIALQLIIDGMKLTACNPGFVDARDAIIQADALSGGQYSCLLWDAFARRGLGQSAKQESSYSHTDGTEAFDLPAACRKELQIELTLSPDSLISIGDLVQGSVKVRNRTASVQTQVEVTVPVPTNGSYLAASASHSGSEVSGNITFPSVSIAVGDSIERTFQLEVSGSKSSDTMFEDDQESGTSQWSTSMDAGSQTWANSSAIPYSGLLSWFAEDLSSISDQLLTLSTPLVLSGAPWLQFWHRYQTESGFSTGYDGGVVEISINNGVDWIDLGPFMKRNGYDKTIATTYNSPIAGRSAFAGNSNGYIRTDIDLSSFAGETALLRFRLGTDSSVGSDGWYIDDVRILDLVSIEASACVASFEGESDCDAYAFPGLIILPGTPFPVEYLGFQAIPDVDHIQLEWSTSIEENNAGFMIERSLHPQFTLNQHLNWISGQGTNSTVAAYTYDDRAVLPGLTYYYRLKQIDLNGAFQYSEVVSARLTERVGVDLEIFPNPSSESVNLSFFSRDAQMLELSVIDPFGQLQEQRIVKSQKDRTYLPLDIHNYAPGVYLVRIRQGLFQASKRLIVK